MNVKAIIDEVSAHVMTPDEAYCKIMSGVPATDELLALVATGSSASFNYALNYIEDRFPLGEPVIANSGWASRYAIEVVKGPWPEGEARIFMNKNHSISYRLFLLSVFGFNEYSKVCIRNGIDPMDIPEEKDIWT